MELLLSCGRHFAAGVQCLYMGSQLVLSGKSGNTEYRIYNIENVYTVYISIGKRPLPNNPEIMAPIYSAVKSFKTLKEAREYVSGLADKK